MPVTSEDLHAFNQFALHLIQQDDSKLTLEDLVAQWHAERQGTTEQLRMCAADMEAGIGRPFDEVDDEIRRKHGFAVRKTS
jgi:hypothetical protein